MTNSTQEMGIFDLILKAGPVVQLVMLLLLVASLLCWAIVFAKSRALKKASSEDQKFLDLFWGSKSLDDVFSRADKFRSSPVASVFRSGYKEYQKLSATQARQPQPLLEVTNIERALSRAGNHEMTLMEKYVGWLATTASAAPFVGLFGTVWGIMTAFQQIGITKNASLAVVAPGISEALIATAIGLFAAIPAAVAYNHFVNKIRRIGTDVETFSSDFLNIVQRGLMSGNQSS